MLKDVLVFFVFYDKSVYPQRLFAGNSKYKHMSTIVFDGLSWVMVEGDGKGGLFVCSFQTLDAAEVVEEIKKTDAVEAIVGVRVFEKHYFKWFPFCIRSCNEIARKISGINIGITFNPNHFFKKLFKKDGLFNYEILSFWRL